MTKLARSICFGSMLLGGLWASIGVAGAQGPDTGIEVVAFHSQRLQDHAAGAIKCEVFGEIKNISDKDLTGVTVAVDFLDDKGKAVASEEMALGLRVIAPRKPLGEARPVKPGEYGSFTQETLECPEAWMEGKIRYKVNKIDWQ